MKFEVEKTYTCRAAGDSELIYSWKVIKRTNKTITVVEQLGLVMDKPVLIKIHVGDDGNEFALPDGRYSMCPVIRAERSQ